MQSSRESRRLRVSAVVFLLTGLMELFFSELKAGAFLGLSIAFFVDRPKSPEKTYSNSLKQPRVIIAKTLGLMSVATIVYLRVIHYH